jgi:predicted RNA-binding protein YlqC (UPF0109 family)
MDLIDDDDVGGDDRTAGEKTVAAVVDSAATPSRQPVPVEKVELLSMDPDSLTEQYQRIGPLISRQGRVLADAIRDLMIAEAQRKAVEGKLYLQARTYLRFNPPETADGKKKEASDTYVEAYWKSQDPFRSAGSAGWIPAAPAKRRLRWLTTATGFALRCLRSARSKSLIQRRGLLLSAAAVGPTHPFSSAGSVGWIPAALAKRRLVMKPYGFEHLGSYVFWWRIFFTMMLCRQ